MTTITLAETIRSETHGGTVRYLFRYTLDNAEVHERRSWVAPGTDEAAERAMRGEALLVELAEAEADQLLEGGA